MAQIVKELSMKTADKNGLGCAKLVVFCNAVEDNPFVAGSFLGPGEPEAVLNVGISGPGVVRAALASSKDLYCHLYKLYLKRLVLKSQELVI